MPRRFYKKRKTEVDLIFSSYEVNKLTNYVMKDGKKTVAQKAVYQALAEIEKKGNNVLEVIRKALDQVAPEHEVRPRRVGGASYLVPVETRHTRKLFLAFNWIINAANARAGKEYKRFSKKLAAELIDASQGIGEAVAKKAQVEKLAEANKAFAHFKW